MSELCTPRFHELADQLGGIPCEDANPVGYLHNPFTLTDGLQPFIELVMVGGAIAALVHAVRRLRRDQEATGLVVWLAAVVYVVVLEPPLYFPEAFGIDDHVPLVFVHNEFTIGFLYQRMPLYILLLYPAMVYLAWSIVARWDLGRDRGLLATAGATAMCVGTVHHVFYEMFDMLGPQRSWWIWDPQVETNGPRLGSVPLSSMVNFAFVMPAAFAFVAVLVIGRRERWQRARWVWVPALLIGVLTPVVSIPGQLPATLLSVAPDLPQLVSVLLMCSVLAVGVLVTVREVLAVPFGPLDRSWAYPLGFGTVYLAALALMWLVALPETLEGGPDVGSLPYVGACFVASFLLLWVAARARRPEEVSRELVAA